MRAAKVRSLDGRWRSWAPSWLASHRPSRLTLPQRAETRSNGAARRAGGLARRSQEAGSRPPPWCFVVMTRRIWDALPNCSNIALTDRSCGRCSIRHRYFAAMCSGTKVDLAARVLAGEPSTLETFVHDIGTIVAMELAQIRLLEEFFDVPVPQARLSFGHSIGELSALVAGACTRWSSSCRSRWPWRPTAPNSPPTQLWEFSRSRGLLSRSRTCSISARQSAAGDKGLIGPSTYLSPYQVLLLGQGNTLDPLEHEMREYLPAGVTLRRKPNHWPPLHTPLVWERNIPNRTAMMMYHTAGGQHKPTPNVVSCTTGLANYDEWNSRAILADWTDHPQRLWDAMEYTLASGAELVIHVGPEPKLLTTCFDRLSHKIMKQLKMRHLDRLGSSVIPSISKNGWLTRKLPANAVLLRAPFLHHLVLEDWLLAQDV